MNKKINLNKKEFDYFLLRFYKDLNLNLSFSKFKIIYKNYKWLFIQ